MRKVFITSFLVAIICSGYAQVRVTIKDHQTGKPLEGVTVYDKQNLRNAVTTNEGGLAELQITQFPTQIILSYVGYQKREVELLNAGEYEFSLEQAIAQLDDVVITGQFEPQSLKKSVYQVRSIGPEIIRMRNATNVQSILNTELGIRFINDPILGTADISLMGMSGQNVKILLDGVPMLDRGATRESLNQIDVNTIERIEIVEGPMSVMYGTDALAGVINIITKKAGSSENSWRVDARILEESVAKDYNFLTKDGVHNQSVNASWRGKLLNAGGGVTRNDFGGWEGANAAQTNWLPKDQLNTYGTIGLKTDNVNVWYRLNYLNENIFTPGVPFNNQVTNKEYITNRFTHQAQIDGMISEKWSLNAVTSYQDYSRRTRTTNVDLLTGRETLSTQPGSQDEAIFTTFSFRGISTNKISSKVSIQSGVDVNFNKGSGERIDRARGIGDYAAFASLEAILTDKISIRPGVRFTYNTAYSAPPVIPSLNAKFSLTDKLDIRAAYGYGFRAPALRELYFNFFDASHSIRGNPNLKAEHSNSTSVSINNRWNVSSTVTVVTMLQGFFNAFENMIDLGIDPADPSVTTYINVYKHRTTGTVFNNTLYWKNLTTLVGFSYIGLYNEFSENDASYPNFVWTPEVNANITYNFEKWGASISLFYKFTGERNNYQLGLDSEGESVVKLASVDSFHWADVSASKRINKYLEVTAGVKNLFDVTSLQNTSTDTGGAHSTGGPVPMSYGRSYFLGLNIQWSK